jgi:RNA polymerase sigma-70 factor (ECF subfamily)
VICHPFHLTYRQRITDWIYAEAIKSWPSRPVSGVAPLMARRSPPEAKAILHRMALRDEGALAELYAHYGRAVYGLAMRVLGHAGWAEETTQDVFLKVWRDPRAWNPSGGTFESWFLTLARYTAIDRLRKETRHQPAVQVPLDDELQADDDPGGDAVEQAQTAAQVRGLLDHLSPEQRQVVELAFFRGMTHSELAAALSLPLGTVKTRLRLALQKLRALWIAKADGEP